MKFLSKDEWPERGAAVEIGSGLGVMLGAGGVAETGHITSAVLVGAVGSLAMLHGLYRYGVIFTNYEFTVPDKPEDAS
jgi:hypothetical protein